MKKEKKDKNGKSEDQKNSKSQDQKKGKSEEQENDENGDKVFYVMINGKKNLVKVVSEDVQDGDSDCSITEQKVPKTLKPFYSVSDSEDDKKKNKQLSQLDGNGNESACHSFSTIELNTSCVSSSTTGIEECGEKISLPPASSGPSFSDTTADDRSIGETLSEIFPSNADSNTDIHFACTECCQTFATENGFLHHRVVFHGSAKDKV